MLMHLITFILSAPPGALGDRRIRCSNGICLPDDYNKMDLPGIKPIHIDTQIFLMEIYEVNERDLTIHINLFMTFSWQDNRLNFTAAREPAVNEEFEFSPALLK